MLYICCCSIPIVIICDVFFFMCEIVFWIRFSVMYHHVSHIFYNFTVIIFSRCLSFYHILIAADWNLSVEESNWYFQQLLIFLKCYNFILFFNKGIVKISSNFSLSHHIFVNNSSTFATFRYFKLNFVN